MKTAKTQTTKTTKTKVRKTKLEKLVDRYVSLGGKYAGLARKWREAILVAKIAELEATLTPEPTPEPAPEPTPEPATEPTPLEVAAQVEAEVEAEVTAPELPTVEEEILDPDVEEWRVVTGVHTRVRAGDRAPCVTGVAFLPSAVKSVGHVSYVLNNHAKWLSLSFLPKGFWQENPWRDRWILQERTCGHRYNIPTVGPECKNSWDWTNGPVPGMDRRLVKTAIALQWSCVSSAMLHRSSWARVTRSYLDFLRGPGLRANDMFAAWRAAFEHDNGREPGLEEELHNSLVLGGAKTLNKADASDRGLWPVPLLGFSVENARSLFDRVCVQRVFADGEWQDMLALPHAVSFGFAADVVKFGGVPIRVGFEGSMESIKPVIVRGLPLWEIVCRTKHNHKRTMLCTRRAELELSPGDAVVPGMLLGIDYAVDVAGLAELEPAAAVITELRKRFVPRHEYYVLAREWFDGQTMEILPGVVHAPSGLVSQAAGLANEANLLWDVSRLDSLWYEDIGGYILPPKPEYPICSYDWTIRSNQIEMNLRLTPQDSTRFTEIPSQWWGLSPSDGRYFGRRADLQELTDDYADFCSEQNLEVIRAVMVARERNRLRAQCEAK